MAKVKNFEENPFYRFFNVILFVLYAIVFLLTIPLAFVGYQTHNLVSATVKCNDGTSWDATKIYYDNAALCGICTQRNNDGTKYQNCNFNSINYYSSYNVTNQKYDWSWATITYPLIELCVGLIIVDFLKIAVIYIFSGGVVLEKSIFLKLLSGLFNL